MRQIIYDYIQQKYDISPEFPWRRDNSSAVFRHADNRKWFALMMDVEREKIELQNVHPLPDRTAFAMRDDGNAPRNSGSARQYLRDDLVCVINLKVDDLLLRDILIREEGIMPAYHMNKLHWITVLLDGTVPQERVFELIDMSYMATASARKKEKIRPPKEWIIPANPQYYDIMHAFDDAQEIDWKQGSGIKTGDTVFLYVAAPVSAIMFQCEVTQTDIPYAYADRNLTIKALMKIRLQKRFAPEAFTFDILKEQYGIFAVRGPRGIPNSLSAALKSC